VWEAKCINVPKDCSEMIQEEKIQVQASLDSGCTNCEFSQYLVKETINNYSDLLDLVLDNIEDHEMPHVQFLGQTMPLLNCLANVNQ
jgi:hypothetical protein